MSSPMALVVAATKRRDTADLDIDLERSSSSAPTGSATSVWRRVATPASIRSTTSELSRSAELNAFQVSSPISVPLVLRPRGRSVLTWRPPSTTEPFALPCQFPTRSWAATLACFSPIALVSSASIIWRITTSPVAEAKANNPSLIAPATSASATVASSGRSANRAASSASATLTTATFFFTVVPFLRVTWSCPIPTIWQVSGGGPPPYFNNVRDNVGATVPGDDMLNRLSDKPPRFRGKPFPVSDVAKAIGVFRATPSS